MKPEEYSVTDLKIEIQKTLISVNDLTSKIRKELKMISDIAKDNGELQAALVSVKETLTMTARNMGINVENVLSSKENEQDLQHVLTNVVSSAAFEEKILACLNNT